MPTVNFSLIFYRPAFSDEAPAALRVSCISEGCQYGCGGNGIRSLFLLVPKEAGLPFWRNGLP